MFSTMKTTIAKTAGALTLAFAAAGCATTAQPAKLCDEACVKASVNNLKAAEQSGQNLEALRVAQVVDALLKTNKMTPDMAGFITRVHAKGSENVQTAVDATLAKQGWSVVGGTCLAKKREIVCP